MAGWIAKARFQGPAQAKGADDTAAPKASGHKAQEIRLDEGTCRYAQETVRLDNETSLLKCTVSGDQAASLLNDDEIKQKDLIPGQYEGGFKLWEGALDLSKFLLQTWLSSSSCDAMLPLWGQRVLELGCGHGLPGLVALRGGAEVHFQDYNGEVLTEITIPTVRANWAAWKVQAQRCTAERESPPARFFSGDWMMFMELLSAQEMCGTYDMVLTSETIYSLDSMHSLVTCIRRCLRPGGVALIAAKSYYFGVGGGTAELLHLLKSDRELQVEQTLTMDDSSSVQREIIVLRRSGA